MSDLVEWMRTAIGISVRGADAFSIEYVHTDPEKAAEVVNRIATLFIEETGRARAEQVEEANSFLQAEVDEARGDLEAKEEAVRRFKESHMGSLPEQSMANLSTLQRLQLQAQAVGEDLRSALVRQTDLEKQLADVSRGASVPEPEDGARKEISQLKSQIADLRTRYTDDYPDVRRLVARLKALESSVPTEPTPANTASSTAKTTLELRVDHPRREVAALQDKRADLDLRIAALQARIDATPRVEQELTTITRDFGNLKENYLELVNKKLDAQMAARLEERWQGERFRVLDPGHVPERPFFPNRALFVAVGIVLGLVVGLAAAVLAEVLDRSFKSPAEVEAALPYPVMAVLPHARPLHLSRSRR
jgi:polysaccharide chain length determinant protein (PEP-CTERM system associated)